ncbi:transposase [Pseudonocardiaceae bacterium YIM PH 21723]|nr:transposase [Pseudonocardiaceae bacterium YIM PH 21723]
MGSWPPKADVPWVTACVEAVTDPNRIVREPDPKSRAGFTRVIGYSPTAGFVVTVIIRPRDHAGVTAWKTSGADLRAYGDHQEDGA